MRTHIALFLVIPPHAIRMYSDNKFDEGRETDLSAAHEFDECDSVSFCYCY